MSTIGQVLPILGLEQLRWYPLVDAGVGDDLGFGVSVSDESLDTSS
ncbi:hypothetical protein PF010_g32188 [Phytophthora fragariae]|uniref:Uncharacterized protein n=1 Tax=Phytophthora fragariae TaxID=53985 RepID=A0A6A4AX77_9STRA|nr:hypothetical protein PF010_g32188 [Phytophthora fragariae]KAE9057198.1 hypothetical protein PF006_g32487 [Phytophthora fragariae]KAE9262116.1 hypothetical protein PF001_g32172 [Phytophthora fragariae]